MFCIGLVVTICALAGTSLAQEESLIDVLPGEMPYHVSVQFRNSFWGFYENSASGVILDETHVLTVTPIWPIEDLSVLSGVTNIQFGSGKRHTIKNVMKHPNYTVCYDLSTPNVNTPLVNNVYIIEVEEPFDFLSGVTQPAKLPPADFDLPGSGVVASWEGGGLFDDNLKKITIPLLNNTHCEHFFGKYRITENMFCGAFIDENGDSYDVIDTLGMGVVIYCKEDPDDPQSPDVVCGLMERPFVLNVLCQEPIPPAEEGYGNNESKRDCSSQSGKTTAFINYPSVFTNISKYLDWINEVLSQAPK